MKRLQAKSEHAARPWWRRICNSLLGGCDTRRGCHGLPDCVAKRHSALLHYSERLQRRHIA